jgi:hypothetical protein
MQIPLQYFALLSLCADVLDRSITRATIFQKMLTENLIPNSSGELFAKMKMPPAGDGVVQL